MHDFEIEPAEAAIRHPRAEEAAETAPRSTAAPPSAAGLNTASVLRLQRTAGNAGVVQLLADEPGAQQGERSPVHDVVGRGGGQPLDGGLRGSMESHFGQDFGNVRVHTDAQASASAESVGADAYTVGNDIVFRSGHLDASSPTGQRTIAHELSHVVQQRSGPVDGTEAAGGIRLSNPSDRFERAADAAADRVVTGGPATQATAPPVQLEEETVAEPSLQREAMDENGEEEEEGEAS
jgi:uncharacterized protein DUF4157